MFSITFILSNLFMIKEALISNKKVKIVMNKID